MAGILVGAHGPAGFRGVATGASVMPIRVAGWQLDAHGKPARLRADRPAPRRPRARGRPERRRRRARRRARRAHPARRAVRGLRGQPRVAGRRRRARRSTRSSSPPPGTTGRPGRATAASSGPGGAPAALTVGAVDERTGAVSARLVLRAGLQTVLDERVPARRRGLATCIRLRRPSPRRRRAAALGALFDRHGFSEVAGRIALVPAGGDPAGAAEDAARAGAAAVVLYGATVPAGSIGLRESVTVPVVSASRGRGPRAARRRSPPAGARPRRSARRAPPPRPQPVAVAPFSSRGLAFDGRVKPDLVAPGVDLLTADPGANEDGTPRFAAVTGSSASAAITAGAAAVLAQARPTARRRRPAPGAARLGAPARRRRRGRRQRPARSRRRRLCRAGRVTADARARPLGASRRHDPAHAHDREPVAALDQRVRRRRARGPGRALAADRSRAAAGDGEALRPLEVRLTVRVVRVPKDGTPALGTIDVTASGGETVRAPLSLTFGQRAGLLGAAQLSARVFKPSDARPAVLTMQVGRVAPVAVAAAAPARVPARPRPVHGRREAARPARAPPRPAARPVCLRAHRPWAQGRRPPSGTYRIKISASPTDGGPATVARVAFRIR